MIFPDIIDFLAPPYSITFLNTGINFELPVVVE